MLTQCFSLLILKFLNLVLTNKQRKDKKGSTISSSMDLDGTTRSDKTGNNDRNQYENTCTANSYVYQIDLVLPLKKTKKNKLQALQGWKPTN